MTATVATSHEKPHHVPHPHHPHLDHLPSPHLRVLLHTGMDINLHPGANPMTQYEVQIELSTGQCAVMLKTNDRGEALAYCRELQTRPKWARNLVKVVEIEPKETA